MLFRSEAGVVTCEWTVVSGAGTVVTTGTFFFGNVVTDVVAGTVPASAFDTVPSATVVVVATATGTSVVLDFSTSAPFASTTKADSAACTSPWECWCSRTVARPAVVNISATTKDGARRRDETTVGTVPAHAAKAARAPKIGRAHV